MIRARSCLLIAAIPAIPIVALFALLAQDIFDRKDAKLTSTAIPGKWEGSGGGMIEFHQNGEFEMSGIPRTAIVFSFVAPPPGKGRLSGTGKWSLDGDGSSSGVINIDFAAGGSFANDSEFAHLQVEESGAKPKMYFDTNPDEWYGYEVHRATGQAKPH